MERGTALVTSDVSWDDLTDIVCRRALGCEWGGINKDGRGNSGDSSLRGNLLSASRDQGLSKVSKYTYLGDQGNPASRGTETSAERFLSVLGPPGG